MSHHGFNVQWMFNAHAGVSGPDERVLDAVAAWGFNFIRLPTDYRSWSIDGDPHRADESVLALVDNTLDACRHAGSASFTEPAPRAGYIITGWETEPYNLWTDRPARDAFVATWERFARRYADVPPQDLSFDLVNEPPALGLRGFTRDAHEAVVRRPSRASGPSHPTGRWSSTASTAATSPCRSSRTSASPRASAATSR